MNLQEITFDLASHTELHDDFFHGALSAASLGECQQSKTTNHGFEHDNSIARISLE